MTLNFGNFEYEKILGARWTVGVDSVSELSAKSSVSLEV